MEHGMHTSVPAQKLQTLTVTMVLVSQATFARPTIVDHQSIYGRWLKVTFAGPRQCITKALRKMVEGRLCKTIAVCVIKTTIHENLLTTFLYSSL